MRVEPQQLKAFMLDANLVTVEQFDDCAKEAAQSDKRRRDPIIEDDMSEAEEKAVDQNAKPFFSK